MVNRSTTYKIPVAQLPPDEILNLDSIQTELEVDQDDVVTAYK